MRNNGSSNLFVICVIEANKIDMLRLSCIGHKWVYSSDHTWKRSKKETAVARQSFLSRFNDSFDAPHPNKFTTTDVINGGEADVCLSCYQNSAQ
ncbi:hypothetical protein AVEN_168592-1 [Araneus ventricosus]|uniref:Uncharacterized protein n=1 Tax=Araneus ventricosus TaxID=182803 RepID=A0A4Y2KJG3_ARAVE|nr:hypothetical protein AVEN_168592-1 [Araneus ventricosus]